MAADILTYQVVMNMGAGTMSRNIATFLGIVLYAATIYGQNPNIQADCGCDTNNPAGVAAVISGVSITQKEVDESLKRSLQKLESDVIEARKRELEAQINSKLLQAEARRSNYLRSLRILISRLPCEGA
jgi:hypothetical protein